MSNKTATNDTAKTLTSLSEKIKRIAREMDEVQYEMETVEELKITPMKDAVYAELGDESKTFKIGEWSNFWEIFFGHYEPEALPVMIELRDQLNSNIESFKDKRYSEITVGGVYVD
jgi:hypothetical protein